MTYSISHPLFVKSELRHYFFVVLGVRLVVDTTSALAVDIAALAVTAALAVLNAT